MSPLKSFWQIVTSPIKSLIPSQTAAQQEHAKTSDAPPKTIRFATPETPIRGHSRVLSIVSPSLRARRRMSENDAARLSMGSSTASDKWISDDTNFRPSNSFPSSEIFNDGEMAKAGLKNSATMPSMSSSHSPPTRIPAGSGKKLSKKLSFTSLMGLNGGSASNSPSNSRTPKRVDDGTPRRVTKSSSSGSSKTPSTPSASTKLSKSPSFADLSNWSSAKSSPAHKTHDLQAALGGLFFDPGTKASIQERPPIVARPKSPSVLLSTVSSQDQLNPKAPPPKHYTVSEYLNTIIKHNIQLPDDNPPPGPSKARATGVRGSGGSLPNNDPYPSRKKAHATGLFGTTITDSPAMSGVGATGVRGSDTTFTDSPTKSVMANDPFPTQSKGRAIGNIGLIPYYIISPPRYATTRKENVTAKQMLQKYKNDPMLKHQPWLHGMAKKDTKKRHPRRYGHTHPDGTPFTFEETIDALSNQQPRRRIADILADMPSLTREEAIADLDDTMKTLKTPDPNDVVCRQHDWANEDWQTWVHGPQYMASKREEALARVMGVQEKHAKRRAERMQKEAEEREKESAAAGKKYQQNQEEYAKKKAKKATSKNPKDWYEGKLTAKDFPKFLELPQKAMTSFMNVVLKVEGEELVPYHYMAGKVIKNPDGTRRGLRKKPMMGVLVALNATHHKKVRKAFDDARNVLYRENVFAFRKPGELIMFMNAIGWINIARMKFDKNLVISSTFFSKHMSSLELKWLVKWHPELRWTMKGLELVTPDWNPEDVDDEYEPPAIETALKTMVEVMDESNQLDAKLAEDNNGKIPSRIQTLDLGESFEAISSRIPSMGLGDEQFEALEDSIKAAESTSTDGGEKVDTIDEEGKDKEKEINTLISKGEHSANDWGTWYWDAAAYEPKTDEIIAREEHGDATSEDSGYYSPALCEDHGELGPSGQADDNASVNDSYSVSTKHCSQLEREVLELFGKFAGPS